MSLPSFYVEKIADKNIVLNEDTSKHIIMVLRMRTGEEILLTDGKGSIATASIIDDNRKRCGVQIKHQETLPALQTTITIAISIIKNASRFEWFLEKATEIGVTEIIPLLCQRTEKEKFRQDRMNGILVSAMLQSQQAWLPILHPPTNFNDVIKNAVQHNKFIAHCLPEEKTSLSKILIDKKLTSSTIIVIGPEGDFTQTEINSALEKKFLPVTLGNNRLRTETAGLVAATLLNIDQ